MPGLRPLARLAATARQRTALLLLALQVGFAAAPLAERADAAAAVAHMDEQGTTHHFAHNEGSCAACTARTLVARAPSAAPTVSLELAGLVAPVAEAHFAPLRRVLPDHPSRAPPAPI